MKKFFLTMFGIGVLIVTLGVSIYLIYKYWEKIAEGLSKGARACSSILGSALGDEDEDAGEYYED